MSGAKKLCTVSRWGGKGGGCGETGLRFNLSSQSRKVCVRGVFQLARFKLRSFMWNKILKTRDPDFSLISSNSAVKCGHKVFFLVHKRNFLLPGETCQSPLHRLVVLSCRNNEASVDTVKPGGCCWAVLLQTSGTEEGFAWWSDSMKVLCRPQPCHVTHSHRSALY